LNLSSASGDKHDTIVEKIGWWVAVTARVKILSQIVQYQIHHITCCMLIFCGLVLQSM
jgi:hypothetical protein